MFNQLLNYFNLKVLFRFWIFSIASLITIYLYQVLCWSDLHYLKYNVSKFKDAHFRLFQFVEEKDLANNHYLEHLEYFLGRFREEVPNFKIELILESETQFKKLDHLIKKYPENLILTDTEEVFRSNSNYQFYDPMIIEEFPKLKKNIIEFNSLHKNGFYSTKMTTNIFESFFKNQNKFNKFKIGNMIFPLKEINNTLMVSRDIAGAMNEVSLDYVLDVATEDYWTDLAGRGLNSYKKYEPLIKDWSFFFSEDNLKTFESYLETVHLYVKNLKEKDNQAFDPSFWESCILGADFWMNMLLDLKVNLIFPQMPVNSLLVNYKKSLTYAEIVGFVGEEKANQVSEYLVHQYIYHHKNPAWIDQLNDYMNQQKDLFDKEQLMFL